MISVVDAPEPCADGSNNQLVDDVCECLPGYAESACDDEPAEGVVECCLVGDEAPPPAIVESEARFVCTDEQPDGGCETRADCEALEGEDGPLWCIEGRCQRVCEGEECMLRRLPGPTCFDEFVRYEIALRNGFWVEGPATYRSEAVRVDPDSGECLPNDDPERSQLLSSRIPLPASDDPSDLDWLAIPECGAGNVVLPSDPNPCRITGERLSGRLFHLFSYEGEQVSALRFSNPLFSIVLDLSSIEGLVAGFEADPDRPWPAESARFLRSRIPRAYRQSFGLDGGYFPFRDLMTLLGQPVTYPLRIVPAPDTGGDIVTYIVDGSGPGSAATVRGQVVRVTLGADFTVDNVFDGVR